MFKPSLTRKTIRLAEYDYKSGGLFFITICIQNHKCILGRVTNYEMQLSEFGKLVEQEWLKQACKEIELQEFVIMPNHFHAIVKLGNHDLAKLIYEFKSLTTRCYINGVKQKGWSRFEKRIWQRNYFEHIIRNDQSYHKISNYILNNPAKWEEDKFFGDNQK
jgi:putative transposase